MYSRPFWKGLFLFFSVYNRANNKQTSLIHNNPSNNKIRNTVMYLLTVISRHGQVLHHLRNKPVFPRENPMSEEESCRANRH